MSLQSEVQAVQRSRGLSFEESWNFLETTRPELFVQSSAQANRLQAKAARQLEREAYAKSAHIEAVAKRLMARDSRLTFGRALEITRVCLPAVQREIAETLRHATPAGKPREESAGRVEAGEDYPPHPGQAAAIAKGLMLVEGGFTTPIIPAVKSAG